MHSHHPANRNDGQHDEAKSRTAIAIITCHRHEMRLKMITVHQCLDSDGLAQGNYCGLVAGTIAIEKMKKFCVAAVASAVSFEY